MKKQEKHIPYKYKVLELFGGIGAPRKALDNLFGDCKIKSVDYVDILNWAVEAYNKLSKTCYLPQSVEKWNMDVDILIHGSPCQDFSLAGKQKGGNAGSGTRSSLLWETIKIIKNKLNKLPRVILWENVKAVLNKNHKHTFDAYIEALNELGYKSQWKVLNGVNYGIPQRRERVFVVSILNNDNAFNHFNFDNLTTTKMAPLSDFLEKQDEIDISYYINQKSMIKAVEMGKIKIIDKATQTITTKQMRWNNAGVIKVPIAEVQKSDTWKNKDKENTIYKRLKKESDAAKERDNFDDYGKTTIPITDHFASNHIWKTDKAIPTIQTAPNNLKIAIPIIETKDHKNFINYRRNTDGKLINGSYNRVWKTDKAIGTIAATTIQKIGVPLKDDGKEYEVLIDKNGNALPVFIIDNKPYHIRLITEREAWRLMGFNDIDYDKIEYLPKSAKYFLAGNSIIVNVLEAIFMELLWKKGEQHGK